MNKYIIRFLGLSGEITTEWVEAPSDFAAIDILQEKIPGIKQILSVVEV